MNIGYCIVEIISFWLFNPDGSDHSITITTAIDSSSPSQIKNSKMNFQNNDV